MEFYHLVTRKPLTIGQKIFFDGRQHNRLYDFFLAQQPENAAGQTVFQVLQQGWTDENQMFLQAARAHEARALREIITELVRLQQFSHLPSRFECLYGTQTLADCERWQKNFESFDRKVVQLIKVTSAGPFFSGDAQLLPTLADVSLTEKIAQAQAYWQTASTDLAEVLIGGEIEVTAILKEFR